ncbi:MAG: serine/threonine-protein kinase, partial [Planctomycetota bacterium]
RIAMRMAHPNIVRALEVGEDHGYHYLAMEFVAGESLGKRLKRTKSIPEEDAVRIIAQVALALHCAHKEGLIHRDIKPDNILLTEDSDAKLADMGLAKELAADMNLTVTGKGLGTPNFMAPEQFRDAKHADVRCDVYSLGATLYMMVTGEIPFRGNGALDTFLKKSKNEFVPAEEFLPSLSERTASVIRLAMSADPTRRPATAKVFAELLTGKHQPSTDPATGAPLLYVVYTDAQGEIIKIKGTPKAIRSRIKRGEVPLGDARGGYTRRGPFLPLGELAEFRDLTPQRSTVPFVASPPIQAQNTGTSASAASQKRLLMFRSLNRKDVAIVIGTVLVLTALSLAIWAVALW